MAKKERGKSLTQLKEDKDKAQRDLQSLQQQTVMIQGVVAYLTQEIRKLEVE